MFTEKVLRALSEKRNFLKSIIKCRTYFNYLLIIKYNIKSALKRLTYKLSLFNVTNINEYIIFNSADCKILTMFKFKMSRKYFALCKKCIEQCFLDGIVSRCRRAEKKCIKCREKIQTIF